MQSFRNYIPQLRSSPHLSILLTLPLPSKLWSMRRLNGGFRHAFSRQVAWFRTQSCHLCDYVETACLHSNSVNIQSHTVPYYVQFRSASPFKLQTRVLSVVFNCSEETYERQFNKPLSRSPQIGRPLSLDASWPSQWASHFYNHHSSFEGPAVVELYPRDHGWKWDFPLSLPYSSGTDPISLFLPSFTFLNPLAPEFFFF